MIKILKKSIETIKKLIINGYKGAGIIYLVDTEVLMQLRVHPPLWSFIGGGFDPCRDCTLMDTAIREFYEETGIVLDPERVVKKPIHRLGFWKYQWHLYIYNAEYKESTAKAPKKYASEYLKYRYVHVDTYQEELANEEHHSYFFFVKYQMKLLKKYIKRTRSM